MNYKISPSILSADFGRLNKEIKKVEKYADILHFDVMDGHFVDNISYGIPVIKKIKTNLPTDCHLMVSNPLKYVKMFAEYSKRLFFHPKTVDNLGNTIKELKQLYVEVGVALNPDEPLSLVVNHLKDIDAVLIMSVYAGFGGQSFMPEVLDKVKKLRQNHKYDKDILIDGGINEQTIIKAKESGANVFVAGSSIFEKSNSRKAILNLKKQLTRRLI